MMIKSAACTASRTRLTGFLVIAACVVASAVGGCAKSQVVPSAGPREATTPAQVKIYEKAPKKYEVLGALNVPISGDVRWDARGDADAGFERLRTDAAALGANGVLLQAPAGAADTLVLAGDKGVYYQVPMQTKTNPRAAVAQAIWVLPEK